MNKFIGNALAGYRNYLNLTKTDFAKRLGVESKLVTAIENGEHEPSTEVISRYFDAFHNLGFKVTTNEFHNLATALERTLPRIKDGKFVHF